MNAWVLKIPGKNKKGQLELARREKYGENSLSL